MKYFCMAVIFAFLLFTVFSCEKADFQTSQLIGKWTIITDSSSTNDACPGCFNGYKYTGGNSDYYTFTDNGIVYIKENGATDTAIYSIAANNRVNIVTDYGVNGGGVFINSMSLGATRPLSYPINNLTYTISNLTMHTVTLTTSGTAMLNGSDLPPIDYIEIINLKK